MRSYLNTPVNSYNALMKIGLFWKLFLLQLLLLASLAALTLLVTVVYSNQNFADHILQRERLEVRALANEITNRYRQTGSLQESASQVFRFHREPAPPPPGHLPRHSPAAQFPPPPPEPIPKPIGIGPMPPLQLLDAEGHYLLGDKRPATDSNASREAIEMDGVTIGWLVWHKFPGHPLRSEFERDQRVAYTWVAAGALILAVLYAGVLAYFMLRPIRRLSSATAALAQRDFSVRVVQQGNDELSRLADDFNHLADAMAGYDQRQRQWVSDIAHELRTPLTSLQAEIEAVQDGVRAPGPDVMQSLWQEVQHLRGLVDDLHLLTVADTGGLHLDFRNQDLGRLLRQALERFQNQLDKAGLNVNVDIELGDAYVDANLLERVWANLIENAIRYTTPPGPLDIRVFHSPESHHIEFSDAGPGVPDAALSRLFDRLFRTDSARSRADGGSGLGLAICKSIIAAHKGQIRADRSDAGGLKISIEIPRGT